MHPFTIAFNPYARVYTLRLLLLGNFAAALFFPIMGAWPLIFLPILVFTHHIFVLFRPSLFRWPVHALAAVDLALVGIELAVSTFFRIATIIKSDGGFWSQRFDFLGCCPSLHPPYTPLRILLNRSLARPLVRGESRIIIFGRAVVLALIAVGVPAVGIYTIVIRPLEAPVYERRSSIGERSLDSYEGNVTIYLTSLNGSDFGPINDARVSAWVPTWVDPQRGTGPFNCPITPAYVATAECPYSLAEIFKLTISISIPPKMEGLYVRVAQGSSPLLSLQQQQPTALLPGAQLFGILTWTKREIQSGPTWGLITPVKTLFTAEVGSLQLDPSSDAIGSNISTLALYQSDTSVTTLIQDTVDATALSGVATFGGFWTFLNGTFALVFGANVVYFAFGKFHRCRRPLSALGVAHIFQRGALARRWHEDFPTIHTEGGTPGSESAGIVAFIRERLVDLGADPRSAAGEPHDIEAQMPPSMSPHDSESAADARQRAAHSSPQIGNKEWTPHQNHPEYRLDEIPLLDLDLGLGEGCTELDNGSGAVGTVLESSRDATGRMRQIQRCVVSQTRDGLASKAKEVVKGWASWIRTRGACSCEGCFRRILVDVQSWSLDRRDARRRAVSADSPATAQPPAKSRGLKKFQV
ncbi:hypothetical protein DFH09DRAFT_1284009 [Mycena vulgaris]|nr:hypothetical protein DFH09DRAFT_1284009 [Mycena vulgaris]